MQRYSVIRNKNPREIVMLRGRGCRYRGCRFCDYHQDASDDEAENLRINKEVLDKVSGCFSHLEIVNSGSFCELDESSMQAIVDVCQKKQIKIVHFECHWLYRRYIPALRKRFAEIGVQVKMKIGVETFDAEYREKTMRKGIRETSPALIAKDFDECCLLFGLPGQTVDSMKNDIETALRHFERVCVNIMVENTAPLQTSSQCRRLFVEEIYPIYKEHPRVDILLHNTDFGVG